MSIYAITILLYFMIIFLSSYFHYQLAIYVITIATVFEIDKYLYLPILNSLVLYLAIILILYY